MRAYIFLNLSPGHQEEVEKVLPKKGVVSYDRLTGEYDGVIIVETTLPELREIIDEIRKKGIVERTVTFISWK